MITKLPGFRSGININWGNLCSCMGTWMKPNLRYQAYFRPRNAPTGDHEQVMPIGTIKWDTASTMPFGESKIYDLLGQYYSERTFSCKLFYIALGFSVADEGSSDLHSPSLEELVPTDFTYWGLRLPHPNSPYNGSFPGTPKCSKSHAIHVCQPVHHTPIVQLAHSP